MFSGHSVREVRSTSASPLWQQLNMLNGRDHADKVIEEATEGGYQALVVTVDCAMSVKSSSALAINLKRAIRYAPELVVRSKWLLGFVRDGMRLSVAIDTTGSGVGTAGVRRCADDLLGAVLARLHARTADQLECSRFADAG
jgi:FMN-dependent dehydrogenase